MISRTYRRRKFHEASDVVDYHQQCKTLIRQLLNHASRTSYDAWGNDECVIINSGEYVEIVNAAFEGECNYLQYVPSTGTVLANFKKMSFKECAEILDSLVNDYI